jgi:uncharacterized protein (DUF2267 family)
MKNKAKCIELRTPDGKVILVLYLYEKEIALEDSPEVSAEKKSAETKKEKAHTQNPQTEEPRMTDAQKRYLFRILAEQGMENDKAYQHLKILFQVDSLKEVTKLEASKMIERLLEEAKGGEDGPPF